MHLPQGQKWKKGWRVRLSGLNWLVYYIQTATRRNLAMRTLDHILGVCVSVAQWDSFVDRLSGISCECQERGNFIRLPTGRTSCEGGVLVYVGLVKVPMPCRSADGHEGLTKSKRGYFNLEHFDSQSVKTVN